MKFIFYILALGLAWISYQVKAVCVEPLPHSFSTHNTNQHSMRVYDKEKKLNYRRSVNGLIGRMYEIQLALSKRRHHTKPNYSRHEFYEWLNNSNTFKILYKNWVDNDYKKELKPSIDRLNDYLPYSFDNIRVVTWDCNNKKGYQDRRNRVNNKVSKSISIYKKSKFSDGLDFIKEYHSIRHASRKTGLSRGKINNLCNKEMTLNGYVWSWTYGEEKYILNATI